MASETHEIKRLEYTRPEKNFLPINSSLITNVSSREWSAEKKIQIGLIFRILNSNFSNRKRKKILRPTKSVLYFSLSLTFNLRSMCYYTSIDTLKVKSIELKGKSKKLPELSNLVQNGFDYENTPIIKYNADEWAVEMAHWELIAPWINNMTDQEESRKRFTTLNARAEKLLESRLFLEPTLKRRCIIPTTGFYEWRTYKGKKYPYFIRPFTSEEDGLFLMAGIYNTWTDKNSGETMDTFAIITTNANSLMEQIHNSKKRMPLLFDKQHANQWLSDIGIDKIKEAISFEYDSKKMNAYTIARDFRSSKEPREEHNFLELPEIVL